MTTCASSKDERCEYCNELLKLKQQLLGLIKKEFDNFNQLNYQHKIVPHSIPILWFGNVEKYFESKQKIITVSLNPSDREFKKNKSDSPSTVLRFPAYDGSVESLYYAYNNYFSEEKSYNTWFKASFRGVLRSFDASHYNNAINTALHTDIGCSYATSPTWSKLCDSDRKILEPIGTKSWHSLVEILEPDIILFSASKKFDEKVAFRQTGSWLEIDVKAKRPLLKGEFTLPNSKQVVVLFQVQGQLPFLQTCKEEKLKFKNYI